MDFFSKTSLSCLLLWFNSQHIKGPKWYRQIPLSCLLWQYQIKKFCSPERYLIHSFECQYQASSPSHSTEAAIMCHRNRKQSCNSSVSVSSFLQFLCFVLLRFGQKWRSFTASSIDWPRADSSFLRIVMAMSVLTSTQAWYQASRLWPELVTQRFLVWQICTTVMTLDQPYLPLRFHADQLIHTPTRTSPPPQPPALSTFPTAKQFLRGSQGFIHFTLMVHGNIILKCFFLKFFLCFVLFCFF